VQWVETAVETAVEAQTALEVVGVETAVEIAAVEAVCVIHFRGWSGKYFNSVL
jgi:hypothetical protein